MRDYAQNDQLVRNLGSRYYQVRIERLCVGFAPKCK